ncbi:MULTISPECIES: hypothetical protein [Actinomadura]|uniref:Matrixin family metalloprotease n=1 Tax=Actinomadura yumaensis TaxID=111807 RepID=A0ABW2CSD4_9ACTN|nr:hypothetical protein [Actinomadura sp. J1-007]MWK34126.1 hypothetical protein [Actinomadura sp. J1-007]
MADNAEAVTKDALGARTQATVKKDPTCDFVADDGRTDVVFEEHGLDPNVLGETWCHDVWASGECDRADVVLSQTTINQVASNDENEYTHTACHELGHTAGLSHYSKGSPPGGTDDCMISGVYDNGAVTWRTYNPHHVGHINAWFDEVTG